MLAIYHRIAQMVRHLLGKPYSKRHQLPYELEWHAFTQRMAEIYGCILCVVVAALLFYALLRIAT